MNPSAFQTNEYEVQSESGVLYLLESLPSYFTYVPNPLLKKNVKLSAWTRPTMPWSISCEWETGGMDRTTAANFYAE